MMAALALLAVGGLACASTGSLSSNRYSADALAEMQFESTYEFLDAHNDVRVAESASEVPLAVRTRRSGNMESPSIGPDTASGGGPGDLGGGGGNEGASGPPGQRSIGASGYTPALLYVDGSEVAGPRSRLREIPLDQIESIQILRPSEASARFGGSGNTGAVAIELKG